MTVFAEKILLSGKYDVQARFRLKFIFIAVQNNSLFEIRSRFYGLFTAVKYIFQNQVALFKGLSSYLFQGKEQQILFKEFKNDVEVPEHSHEAQWGAVLSGEIEPAIEGRKNILKKGDIYFVPAGTRHSAKIKGGYKDITLFDQKDNFQET